VLIVEWLRWFSTLLSIFNKIGPKKNARDTPSQRKACKLDRIREMHQKNTSPCTYSSALIGGRLRHHRHTWMAYRMANIGASNISQVILVRLTHPFLPLFWRRAPRSNPLIPLFRRRAPRHDPPLPLFRRRVPHVDPLIPLFRRRAPRVCPSVILTTQWKMTWANDGDGDNNETTTTKATRGVKADDQCYNRE